MLAIVVLETVMRCCVQRSMLGGPCLICACHLFTQAVTEMLANMEALERMFDLSSVMAAPGPAGKR